MGGGRGRRRHFLTSGHLRLGSVGCAQSRRDDVCLVQTAPDAISHKGGTCSISSSSSWAPISGKGGAVRARAQHPGYWG